MTYLLTMAYLFSPRPSIQRRPGMDQVGTNENSKGHLLIDGFQLHHQETIRCWECVCVCKNHCRMLECRSTRNRKNQIFKSCEVRLWSAILFFSHKSSTWNRSSPQSQRCWRSWANTPEGLVKMSMKGRDKPLGIHVLKLGKTKTPQKKVNAEAKNQWPYHAMWRRIVFQILFFLTVLALIQSRFEPQVGLVIPAARTAPSWEVD